MSIQKRFLVRYRAEGHVRFQVPDELADATVANEINTRISLITGIHSVALFRRQRKLSIRFQEAACDINSLARQLFDIIAEMEKQGWFEPKVREVQPAGRSAGFRGKLKNLKVSRWASDKYGEAKETLHAAKVITKLGLKKPNALIKDPEKAIIDFLNDILVLYLIKLHWPQITKEWLPKPWTHRYEWTAVFYMFYLLMRSRRPKK